GDAWPKPLDDAHRVQMISDYFIEAPIGHRAFIESSADQGNADRAEPILHFLARKPASSLVAAEQASGSMYRRTEEPPGLLAVEALEDHGRIAHGAADETTLAWESRRCALAHDP